VRFPAELRRRVAMVVAVAERYLDRPLRSALDVGCGEGSWGVELRRLRPRLRYLGLDPSEYAVRRFGARRHLVAGTFADLPALAPRQPVDLVLCVDVLHYLDDTELDAGLPALAAATGGLAYLEVLSAEEEIVGDLAGLRRRSAAWWRRRFAAVGLAACGSNSYLSATLADRASALELVGEGSPPAAGPGSTR